jgi:hypothetical protein
MPIILFTLTLATGGLQDPGLAGLLAELGARVESGAHEGPEGSVDVVLTDVADGGSSTALGALSTEQLLVSGQGHTNQGRAESRGAVEPVLTFLARGVGRRVVVVAFHSGPDSARERSRAAVV